MLRTSVLSLCVVGLSLSGLPGGTAAEPSATEVQAAYDSAMVDYQAGRFSEAARGFERAYAMQPDAALLWNIGRSWEQAGELTKARDRYTEFLSHEAVNAELRVKVADALVRVGGKIQARQDAKTQEERIRQLRKEITEAEADRNAELMKKLQGELDAQRGAEPPPATAKPAASEPAPASTTLSQTYEPQKSRPSVWSWVLLGTGVAALATGAGMLVDAKVKRDSVHSAIDNARAGFVTAMSLTDAEGLESDANRNAAIGVATLATGGALAVTGLVVALVTRGRSVEQGVSFGAQPRDGGAMFSASGRF